MLTPGQVLAWNGNEVLVHPSDVIRIKKELETDCISDYEMLMYIMKEKEGDAVGRTTVADLEKEVAALKKEVARISLPDNTKLSIDDNFQFNFDAVDYRKPHTCQSFAMRNLNEVMWQLNNLGKNDVTLEMKKDFDSLKGRLEQAVRRTKEVYESFLKDHATENQLLNDLPSIIQELRTRIGAMESLNQPFEVFKASLDNFESKLKAAERNYELSASANAVHLNKIRGEIQDFNLFRNEIRNSVKNLQRKTNGIDMAKIRDLEWGKRDEKDLEFKVPLTEASPGDVLVMNHEGHWECKAPIKVTPKPKVSLIPRFIMGLFTFSPIVLLFPAFMVMVRLLIASTVPSYAHRIPGFKSVLKSTWNFVFKDDMGPRHIVTLIGGSSLTAAAAKFYGMANWF